MYSIFFPFFVNIINIDIQFLKCLNKDKIYYTYIPWFNSKNFIENYSLSEDTICAKINS